MRQVILYEDKTDYVFVLDLPSSIEVAQGPGASKIASNPPLLKPYHTPEPKGVKRDTMLAQTPLEEREYHETLCNDIERALRLVAADLTDQEWCRPRNYMLVPVSGFTEAAETPVENVDNAPPIILSLEGNIFPSVYNLQQNVVCNTSTEMCIATCVSESVSFFIPAGANFFWGTIREGLIPVSEATKDLEAATQSNEAEGLFDLMLLDPPWTNRSVRKSRSYLTAEHQHLNIFDQLMPFIRETLRPCGWVAVWITNKAAVRANVIENLLSLNLVLHEEWIWCKVTKDGEPMTPLRGIWRKPYEVLLLFHRHRKSDNPVQRRFIFAVPDVHSRKPNLKGLFEKLLPQEYVAIELFARNLTAGWWAWGDEVLKFQDLRLWQDDIK